MEKTNGKRLEKQLQFLLEIDKEKFVERQTYLSDGKRRENDAEHAWHMAVMTLLLSEYSNTPIDVLKTVAMVLIHDLVEIYAGDTYAYDEAAKETQTRREADAADRLFAMLPADQADKIRALWEEFDAGETQEARFANTMDNLQPTMLNNSIDGQGWVEHHVTEDQILERNQHTAEGSRILWDYSLHQWIEPHVRAGHIASDGKTEKKQEQDSKAEKKRKNL